MAIKSVKPGGYGPNQTPRASELAQVDERLATYGLDASIAGDTVTGVLSLEQSPYALGTHPKITAFGDVRASHADAKIETANGGRLVLGDGDVPQYNPATRTRKVRVSFLEAHRSNPHLSSGIVDSGDASVVDPASGGIYSAPPGFGAAYHLTIEKPMDGAALSSVRLWFYFRDDPGSTINVGVVIGREAVPVGGVTGLTVMGGNAATYGYVSGTIQTLNVTGLVSNTIDLQTYTYFLQMTSCVSQFIVYTAYELNYTSIADERFTQ